MKAINILNFSVSTIVIVLAVLCMCFNGFSIGLSFIVALAVVYAVFELFAIVADFTNGKHNSFSYPIGSTVICTGNNGKIEHYLTAGSSYEVIGYYGEDALIVRWGGTHKQTVNIVDIKES